MRWQQWRLSTKMYFSLSGLISQHTNLSDKISSNKTYVRLRKDSLIKSEEQGLMQGTTEASSSTNGDWIVWE